MGLLCRLTATLTATSADDGCGGRVVWIVGRAEDAAEGVDGLSLEAESDVGVEGRSRKRRCTVPVSDKTASTSSNGTNGVSSPRCPGASRPAATVTVRVMAVSRDGTTR